MCLCEVERDRRERVKFTEREYKRKIRRYAIRQTVKKQMWV